MPWPPGGLNRAWLLAYRTWAESGRNASLAVRLGVDAVRSADRTSPYALAGALEVLALACARSGNVDAAHALLAYAKAQDAPTFDSSTTGALQRELRQALEGHGPPPPAPPVGSWPSRGGSAGIVTWTWA